MSTLAIKIEVPNINNVIVTDDSLTVDLDDVGTQYWPLSHLGQIGHLLYLVAMFLELVNGGFCDPVAHVAVREDLGCLHA